MVEDGEFRIVHESEMDALPGEPEATERPGEPAVPPAVAAPAVRGRARSNEEQGGVVGVVSRSDAPSLRIYNGATRYSQWIFLYTAVSDAPGRTPAGPTGDAAPGLLGSDSSR